MVRNFSNSHSAGNSLLPKRCPVQRGRRVAAAKHLNMSPTYLAGTQRTESGIKCPGWITSRLSAVIMERGTY
jgi:hypothetical protein